MTSPKGSNVTDPTQALDALAKVKTAVDKIQAAGVKAGWRTTEFWLVVLGYVATAITLVFHQDFGGYVQVGAVVASGIATVAYSLGRAHLKKPVSLSSLAYDFHALVTALEQVSGAGDGKTG